MGSGKGKTARRISTRIENWVNCNRQHSAELFGQRAVVSETLRHEGGASRASAYFIGIGAILAGSRCASTPALFRNRSWNVALSRHQGTQARVAVPLGTVWVRGYVLHAGYGVPTHPKALEQDRQYASLDLIADQRSRAAGERCHTGERYRTRGTAYRYKLCAKPLRQSRLDGGAFRSSWSLYHLSKEM